MDNGWHLDRKVSVGHILTTVTVATAMLFAWARLEGRVSLVEQAIQGNQTLIERIERDSKERIARSEQRVEAMHDDLKSHLVRIEDKLDQKADKD